MMQMYPPPPWPQFTELIPSDFTVGEWEEHWLYYPEDAGGGAKFLGWLFRIYKKRPDRGKILMDTVQVRQGDVDRNPDPKALECFIRANVEIAVMSLRDLEQRTFE